MQRCARFDRSLSATHLCGHVRGFRSDPVRRTTTTTTWWGMTESPARQIEGYRPGVLFFAKLVAIVIVATVSGAVAVPLGVFADVNPILVFALASVTAVGVAWGLVLGGDRLRARFAKGRASDSESDGRARRVFERFGPVGLGLIGPVFPGVVASSLSGVAVGVDPKRLGIWLTIGIGLWFGLFTVAWWGVREGLFR